MQLLNSITENCATNLMNSPPVNKRSITRELRKKSGKIDRIVGSWLLEFYLIYKPKILRLLEIHIVIAITIQVKILQICGVTVCLL